MRLTPNRLRSNLDRDSAGPEGYRDRSPLDSAQKAHGQTDKGIAVSHLLHLVRTRITNLCSGPATLTRLRITDQLTAKRLQRGTSLKLRREQINRTVESSSGNLVTGLRVERTHRVSTFGQHEKSHLLRRDTNLANGSNILRHDLPHKRFGLLSRRNRNRR
jgi:hypothetical protein